MPTICGKEVGPIGYGLMGLTWRKTPVSDAQAFAAMKAALSTGCNFWNGGEFYGQPDANSLTLLRRYFEAHPEDISRAVISIKGGINLATLTPDGSKEGVDRSIDACLAHLGGKQALKKIDTFECARVDPNVPIGETLAALQARVDAGDIGGISLSEVSARTIDAAAKMGVKVDTVEVELSIWAPDVLSNGVAAACARHDIPMVAYSPLGRAMLTGSVKSIEDIPVGDIRLHLPRFQPGALEQNLQLCGAVEKIAQRKGCTPAQLAVGWVRALGSRPGMPVIVPIPGSASEARVIENSTQVAVTDAEMDEIQQAINQHKIIGGRYPDGHPIEG